MPTQPVTVEAYDEEHAMEIMSQYFRSYDMLALQAIESGEGVRITEMCSKRDSAYREYCRVTGIPLNSAYMAIMQPNGMI